MVSIITLQGIGLALCATTMFTVAAILQKLAVHEMEEITMNNVGSSVKSMIRNKKWLIGFILANVGGIPYFIAVALIGITVVEPLNNVGFIFLALSAKKILKEHLKLKDHLAIFSLILMPVFLGLSSVSRSSKNITDSDVWIPFLIFTFVLLIIIGAMYLGTKKIAMLWTGIVSLLISLGTVYLQSTLSFLEAGGYDILMDLPEIFENIWIDRNIHLAALMGVFSFVFYTISSYFYQIALQKIPASKCVPIIQTFDNFFTITVGILIFGQLIGNWFFYIIALVISVLGAFVLGKYQMK